MPSNPYAPPQAPVADTAASTASTVRRPKLVWVITIFYGIASVFSAFSYYLIFSGRIALPANVAAYLDGLTAVDHTISLVGSVLTLAAACFLFLMRKPAAHLFTASLAWTVLNFLWQIAARGWLEAASASSVFGALLGTAISSGVCAYAWRLLRHGKLR